MSRNRAQVIWDFVQAWLAKAETDLRAARHILNLEQDDYFAVAFHAQQAAEKLLKGFLVYHQVTFRKTHDIEQLVQLATPNDATLATELASAGMLTPYGVEFRYPIDEIVDFDTARTTVHEAERVKEAVLQRLAGYLNRGRPGDRS